ncbi:MAG: hypothetical protein M0009_12660 [Deltaproteobacteria bacterium]|nr:hypothetical protein [Deltaproteobacteria bacterium]
MSLHLRKTVPTLLAALFLAGCASPAPIEKGTAGTIGSAPSTQERKPASGVAADRALFDEGIALLCGAERPEPAKARSVLNSLIQYYPQSRWRSSAETLVGLIDAAETSRETNQKMQLLTEQLLEERTRTLQEKEQLKKTIRELTEKQQTETQALAQENEQLKKDLQRLKTLEIELEKRERMLR